MSATEPESADEGAPGAVRVAEGPASVETRRAAPRPRAAPRDALEWQLTLLWERLLDRCAIGVHDDFFALGGTRYLAERMLEEIARSLGSVVAYEALERAPTVAALAFALRGRDDCYIRDALLPIRARGTRTPFFLVHRARGHLLPYQQLVEHLSPDLPVYGLQAVERAPDTPLHTTIEEMAAHQLATVRRVQPVGPYRLGGSSFGGVLAFEMARRLEQQGERVSLLAQFDTDLPRRPPGPIGRAALSGRRTYRYGMHHLRETAALPAARRPAYVGAVGARVLRRVVRRVLRMGSAPGAEDRGEPQPLVPSNTIRVLYAAFYAYRPQRYRGRVTLFCAQQHRLPGIDLRRDWKRYVRDVVEIPTTGGHLTMLAAPHVDILARALGDVLDRAEEPPADCADV